MKTSFPVFLLVLAAVLCGLTGQATAAEDEDLRTVADGNTAFALNLYGRLRGERGNIFISPFSISAALAMTMAGAAGNTEKEMSEVLN